MSKTFTVRFGGPASGLQGQTFGAVELPEQSLLSEELDANNSPLLFGCRTGICGTCLVTLEVSNQGPLDQPDASEREMLEVYAAGCKNARLACQVRLTCDLKLTPLKRSRP